MDKLNYPLWFVVIGWFEDHYGYNSDPSKVADGDILRWALQQRQRVRARVDAGRGAVDEASLS